MHFNIEFFSTINPGYKLIFQVNFQVCLFLLKEVSHLVQCRVHKI
jgi:hypothetical protein